MIHTCVCIRVNNCICFLTYAHDVRVYTNKYVSANMYVCMYAYLHVTYACTCTLCVCVCVCSLMYFCVCIYHNNSMCTISR